MEIKKCQKQVKEENAKGMLKSEKEKRLKHSGTV